LTQFGIWEVVLRFTYRLEDWNAEFLKTIIFINGQIKTYVTSFNGFQNVC